MELTYNFPILTDSVDCSGSSLSERLEARLTDIQQVGTNETSVQVTREQFTGTVLIMFGGFFYATYSWPTELHFNILRLTWIVWVYYRKRGQFYPLSDILFSFLGNTTQTKRELSDENDILINRNTNVRVALKTAQALEGVL